MEEVTYSPVEVARICAVCKSTIVEWAEAGKVAAFRTPNGSRRFRASELCRFLREYKIPIPQDVLEAAGKGER